MKTILSLFLFLLFLPVAASAAKTDQKWDKTHKVLVYQFSINKEIGPAVWRITRQGFREARQVKADLIIIRMNTYGGALDAADSIRTSILKSSVPVYVFVDNNAASAGALISIAANRIYMREGSSIGAATVVDQTGKPMPDKYQSFMRSMMRATAEFHGKDTVVKGKDTTVSWRRDPLIAEAMVNARYIAGVNDSGKVLSFTTEEAIKHGYCEGKASSVEEVIRKAGITRYELKEYKLTAYEGFMGFLVNPIVQGILIMLIIAGIYYELQTPGIGVPLFAAIVGAILYFAPLYADGLAQNWEIVLFIVGLILVIIEIFAIPGFGFIGITGIVLMVAGLTLSMVDNKIFELGMMQALNILAKSIFVVIISIAVSLVASIYFSSKLITSSRIEGLSLKAQQQSSEGYVSFDDYSGLIGAEGVASTMLRPSGKVEINGQVYDAMSEVGYIDRGESIIVRKTESGQVYVSKI